MCAEVCRLARTSQRLNSNLPPKKGHCFARGYQGTPREARGHSGKLRDTGRQRNRARGGRLAHARRGGRGVRHRPHPTVRVPDKRGASVGKNRAYPAHPQARPGQVPRRADDGNLRRLHEVAPIHGQYESGPDHGKRTRPSEWRHRGLSEGAPVSGRGRLSPAHRRMLFEESGIGARVAVKRGYRTVTSKAELERLGFGRSQRSVPALLMPIFGPAGEIVLYQSRPDEPRIGKRGKPVKYETPSGAGMALDVHPFCRERIGDPCGAALRHGRDQEGRRSGEPGGLRGGAHRGVELARDERARRQDGAPGVGTRRPEQPQGLRGLRLRRHGEAGSLRGPGATQRVSWRAGARR